jgi:hypothetical protein
VAGNVAGLGAEPALRRHVARRVLWQPALHAPYGAVRWTVRQGVVANPRGYRGTVDDRGRVRMRYPGPYYGKMNVVVARLSGNEGTGTVDVEGTRCRSTIRITRVKD